MFECFDTTGEKIRRVGYASVKRVLNYLHDITPEGEFIWAVVSCPDAGVYISRYDKIYSVAWYAGKDLHEEDFKKQKEAIDKFLEKWQFAKGIRGNACSV